MKVLINFLLVFTLALSCKSSKTNNNSDEIAYFVRHAEKADDGSKNPPLTTEGQARAEKLAEMLKEKGISAIYSTDYTRTKMTGKVLADHLGLELTIYSPKDSAFAENIKQQIGKKSILVVGHSNSTPQLVNTIIGQEKYEQIDESDYENIFKITEQKGELIAVKESF